MFRSLTLSRLSLALPFALMAATVILPDVALAQDDIKAVSERVEENITAVKSLALSLMFLIGLITLGAGIFLIYKDTKQPNQGHAKTGVIGILVGALLLSVPTVVGVMGSTVLGGDQDAQDNITAGQGF